MDVFPLQLFNAYLSPLFAIKTRDKGSERGNEDEAEC